MLFLPTSTYASGIDKNTARMQAMDKITGRVSVINVPVNGKIDFGSLSIVVRSCKTRPPEETPDNFAFADITDHTFEGNEINIFKGWMISSSPATHAVEHPIYDVWLLQCVDSDIDETLLLDEEQLSKRDSLPMQKNMQEQKNNPQTGELNMSEPISEMKENEHFSNELIESPSEFAYDEDDITITEEDNSEISVDDKADNSSLNF